MPRRPDPSEDDVRLEDVRCLRATEKAILCEIEGDEVWIPQSQVTEDSEVWKPGQEGTLVITRWIARQKDLG
jgi:hypothetical protein